MSWHTMAKEIATNTPCPYPYCRTLVNRAWKDLQRKYIWSFLWGDAAVPTPTPQTLGLATVTIGSNQVIGNTQASAAWAAMGLVNPITTQQFRIGQGTIYNIIAYDVTTNPPFGTLTLDKIYVDPFPGTQTYQIYGVYYNAPTQDFLWWESIRDPISGYPIRTTMTREFVDLADPQRFQSGWPVAVIPYQVNPQVGNFYQFPMYEIWPAPLNNYTYVGTYFRKGMPFVNDNDTVPAPLGEDIVIQIGSEYAYEWCEANREKVPAAAAKADFRFLMGKANKKTEQLLTDYIRSDSEFSHRHVIPCGEEEYIQTLPWVSQRNEVMYAP